MEHGSRSCNIVTNPSDIRLTRCSLLKDMMQYLEQFIDVITLIQLKIAYGYAIKKVVFTYDCVRLDVKVGWQKSMEYTGGVTFTGSKKDLFQLGMKNNHPVRIQRKVEDMYISLTADGASMDASRMSDMELHKHLSRCYIPSIVESTLLCQIYVNSREHLAVRFDPLRSVFFTLIGLEMTYYKISESGGAPWLGGSLNQLRKKKITKRCYYIHNCHGYANGVGKPICEMKKNPGIWSYEIGYADFIASFEHVIQKIFKGF